MASIESKITALITGAALALTSGCESARESQALEAASFVDPIVAVQIPIDRAEVMSRRSEAGHVFATSDLLNADPLKLIANQSILQSTSLSPEYLGQATRIGRLLQAEVRDGKMSESQAIGIAATLKKSVDTFDLMTTALEILPDESYTVGLAVDTKHMRRQIADANNPNTDLTIRVLNPQILPLERSLNGYDTAAVVISNQLALLVNSGDLTTQKANDIAVALQKAGTVTALFQTAKEFLPSQSYVEACHLWRQFPPSERPVMTPLTNLIE